jgi:type I restriction enzyme, S subunit
MIWENGGAPEGWTVSTLGDVATVVGGGTPKTNVPGNFSEGDGHPWITPKDLTHYEDKYISRGKRSLTDQGLATSSAKYVPAGSVLFSTRAPIGYVAVAANPVTTNQGFRSFVPTETVDSEYIYYALKFLRPLAEERASGTTFAELSGSNAAKLPIAYPSLAEQRAIVLALDTATEKSRSATGRLSAVRRTVERFSQAVLAGACSGRLSTDWRASNQRDPVPHGPSLSPTADANASDSPNTDALTEIPDPWAWWPVEAITDQVIDYRGRTPPSERSGPIPHVRTTQIRRGRINWQTDRFVTQEVYDNYMTRGIPRRGDVLLSMEAPMGEVGVVDRDSPFSIAQRILLLRPGNHVTPDFLALSLRSHHVRRSIEYRATGTGVLGIAYKRLRSVLLPIPPIDEQVEIVRCASQLLALADELQIRIEGAEQGIERSSRAVLAKAFRGELLTVGNGDVPDET